MRLHVSHVKGSRSGEEVFFDTSKVLIGRKPSCNIVFDPDEDILVSGDHAELIREGDGWLVRDLGSTNGTLVAGKKIKEQKLRSGDEIEMGKGGPRIIVEWSVDSGLDAPTAGQNMEGATVMMSLQSPKLPASKPMPASIPPTARISAVAATPKKAGQGLSKMAKILMSTIILLLAVAIAVVLSSPRKRNAATPTGATSTEIEDLRRQVLESEKMIEDLQRQLREKNDEIERLREGAGSGSAIVFPRRAPNSAPVFRRAGLDNDLATRGLRYAFVSSEESSSDGDIVTGKRLRLPMRFESQRSSIRGMPTSAPKDLESYIQDALESAGIVTESKGRTGALIEIEITDFNLEKTGRDTKKTQKSISNLGKLGGIKVDKAPVDVATQSEQAEIEATVWIYDENDDALTDASFSSSSEQRKTQTTYEGVKMGEKFRKDTPSDDVLRQVAADAVDFLIDALKDFEWSTTVKGATSRAIKIDCGEACLMERGDLFDVYDEAGEVMGRLEVRRVSPRDAEANIVSGEQEAKSYKGKVVRYVGNQGGQSRHATNEVRQLYARDAAPAFSGPGMSFDHVTTLRKDSKVDLVYEVGDWARVKTSEGTTHWIYWDFLDDVDKTP